MVNVKLCPTYEEAVEIAKQIAPCGAIECEYGDKTITEHDEGVRVAMYHHGIHSGNPAPSIRWDVYDSLDEPLDSFIISHIDLDTIMGIMWASKILKPTSIAKKIGEIAEIQDLNGFHYIEREILKDLTGTLKYRFLGAGYIVSNIQIDDNKDYDVSRQIHKAILKIKDIIIDGIDENLKNKIDFWLKNKHEEAKKCLKFDNQFLNFYVSDKNMISAYCLLNDNNEMICKDINLQYNTANNSITLTCFNEEIAVKYFGEDGVLHPLKNFFGDKAGGRIAVGGGPRSEKLSLQHANAFLNYILTEYINPHQKMIENQHN